MTNQTSEWDINATGNEDLAPVWIYLVDLDGSTQPLSSQLTTDGRNALLCAIDHPPSVSRHNEAQSLLNAGIQHYAQNHGNPVVQRMAITSAVEYLGGTKTLRAAVSAGVTNLHLVVFYQRASGSANDIFLRPAAASDPEMMSPARLDAFKELVMSHDLANNTGLSRQFSTPTIN